MKKLLSIQVMVIFLFCWVVSADGITADKNRGEIIRIKDAMGRFVEVGLPVKRMVALTSDALEV
ncbi:MAG: hypothetical protein JRJ77_19120, partial [Deltaproteobacteria bacterium]|nr:hypothetical protein [Deltaproteobacteria bacterium]